MYGFIYSTVHEAATCPAPVNHEKRHSTVLLLGVIVSINMKNTKKPTKKALLVEPRHHHLIAETAGWIGAACLLSGYVMVSYGIIPPGAPIYHILNIVAACGLITIALVKKLYQSILVNSVWLIVAIIALINLFLHP